MANRLKEIRENRGLSQEQLGERVGTDKSTISKLERSKRQLTQRWLDLLGPALKCTPGDILAEIPTGEVKEKVRDDGQSKGVVSKEAPLTEQEDRLLFAFRSVDNATREMMVKEVNNLAENFRFDQQKNFSGRRAG